MAGTKVKAIPTDRDYWTGRMVHFFGGTLSSVRAVKVPSFLRVTRWPPMVWGILYVLAIPGFAFIFEYGLEQHSFYHSTMQHEPEVRRHSRDFLQNLWDSYSSSLAFTEKACERLDPLAREINLDSLRIDGDDVSFTMKFYVGSFKEGTQYEVEPRVHFSVQRNLDVPWRLPPGKGRGSVYKELTLEGLPIYPKLRGARNLDQCFFPSDYYERLPQNIVMLRLPVPLDDELHTIADEMRGFPPRGSDDFIRMVYLSASTITTAGFGDIVPTTRAARIAVTTESILGVILIGMFLNAISRRSSMEERK